MHCLHLDENSQNSAFGDVTKIAAMFAVSLVYYRAISLIYSHEAIPKQLRALVYVVTTLEAVYTKGAFCKLQRNTKSIYILNKKIIVVLLHWQKKKTKHEVYHCSFCIHQYCVANFKESTISTYILHILSYAHVLGALQRYAKTTSSVDFSYLFFVYNTYLECNYEECVCVGICKFRMVPVKLYWQRQA